ncbi:MAG: nitrous oxide reductase family maturation protein NosD [Bacteroidota bacterium]
MRIAHAFIFLLICGSYATANTLRVGTKANIQKLTDAVALAQQGDTILVEPGTYREGNVLIQKKLFVIGLHYPILDGEDKFEIFTIHANGVVVQGFHFQNTGIASINDLAAIKVLDSHGIAIRNNRFTNTFFGIYLSNSTGAIIENNELQSDADAEHQIANGIHLWKCDDIIIRNNRIKGHRDGIYFEFVTNSTITNNHSEANLRYGLHFMFSHNDEYRENTFLNNGAGVAVMYTQGVKMIRNTFSHNWGSSSYGLLLKDIRDSFVTDNLFIANSVGIFMEGSSRNEMKNNRFVQNGYAIKLQASCDDNTFRENNFQQNTFDLVTNGHTVLNTIERNYWDRYEGYDLNRDQVGDVPYRPISVYGMIVERVPTAILLWRSFLVFLLDKAEKAMPAITPENLKDNFPSMQPYDIH